MHSKSRDYLPVNTTEQLDIELSDVEDNFVGGSSNQGSLSSSSSSSSSSTSYPPPPLPPSQQPQEQSHQQPWKGGSLKIDFNALNPFSSWGFNNNNKRSSSTANIPYSLVQPTSSSTQATPRTTSTDGGASSSSSSAGVPRPPTNDGVFANLSAKPEVERPAESELRPPTYETALQDVSPSYFETTVVAPNVFGDEILVDGLPVGNIFQFFWNIVIATSFQFVGVLLTYLLHNSHASKSGSMVGLGFTLINFGIQMRGGDGSLGGFGFGPDGPNTNGGGTSAGTDDEGNSSSGGYSNTGYLGGPANSQHPGAMYAEGANGYGNEYDGGIGDENRWVAFFLLILGWLITVRAVADYARAKRTELVISAQSRVAVDVEASGGM